MPLSHGWTSAAAPIPVGSRVSWNQACQRSSAGTTRRRIASTSRSPPARSSTMRAAVAATGGCVIDEAGASRGPPGASTVCHWVGPGS